MYSVTQKVRSCLQKLQAWGKVRVGNSAACIQLIKNEISQEVELAEKGDLDRLRLLEKDLSNSWEDEENYWRQKSRIDWLRLGDKITAFKATPLEGIDEIVQAL
ncbi:hypothetical protein F0562_005844 [Nyssa sinensis]|uniref:Uncharacterized protein n=1 Tax=Nyssa sinensis TaxID=561372 RepID=A0A5J5AJC0_9ASTE|nr:hypothetical protein F0562_005844 [Nyssa sinensis]